MKRHFLLMFVLCTLFSQVSFAQFLNGDLNHNGDLDVDDITLLINGYLTGEKEWINPNDSTDTPSYEAVDLGLSVKWATMNVGANAPEECGDYFAWGETAPKRSYWWYTYKYSNENPDMKTDSIAQQAMLKYCTSSSDGVVDNKTVLDLEDDAAHVNWGGAWRMPTYEEMNELVTYCTWEWTSLNGMNGRKVTGPNGNSIFLPAAGSYSGTMFEDLGRQGRYWTSSLGRYGSKDAWRLVSYESDYVMNTYGTRCYGLTVRAVCP